MSRFCKTLSTGFMSCEQNIQGGRKVPTPLLVCHGRVSNRKVMQTNSATIPICMPFSVGGMYTHRSKWKVSRGMVSSWPYCKPQHKMHTIMSSNLNLWEIAPRIKQIGCWLHPNSHSENGVKEKYL